MVRLPLALFRTVSSWLVVGTATLFAASYLIVLVRIRPESRQVPAVMELWARTFLFWTGTKVAVEGAEQIDTAGSYVFVGNHTSNLDIPVIMAKLPVSNRFLTKKELFRVPILGGAMKAINMVETDRRAGPLAHRVINEQVSRVIGRGLSLMVFPEGTRTEDGTLLPFKKGAFRIAIDNSMPVVPVTILGAYDAWHPRSLLIRGGPVRLLIHQPIPTAGLERTDLEPLLAQAKAVIGASLPPSRTLGPEATQTA